MSARPRFETRVAACRMAAIVHFVGPAAVQRHVRTIALGSTGFSVVNLRV